jgi:hypothetical protein
VQDLEASPSGGSGIRDSHITDRELSGLLGAGSEHGAPEHSNEEGRGPAVLVVHRASSGAALARGLADVLSEPLTDPFAQELVAVPAKGLVAVAGSAAVARARRGLRRRGVRQRRLPVAQQHARRGRAICIGRACRCSRAVGAAAFRVAAARGHRRLRSDRVNQDRNSI